MSTHIAIPLPQWADRFLSELEATGLHHSAAVAAQTTMRAVKKLRTDSIEFDEAVIHAEQIANDELEREARRRAVEGIEKGVYYKGILYDTERVFSDSLLTTLLKAKRPDEFAERKQISGPGGGPLTVMVRSFGTDADGNVIDLHPIIDGQFTEIAAPSNRPDGPVPSPAGAKTTLGDLSLAEVLDMV